jgi:uroporphyrinogen decarboxylase
MRRQAPDRVPHEIGISLTPQKYEEFRTRTGQEDAAAYFGCDTRPVGILRTSHPLDHAKYHTDSPPGTTWDEWGIGYLKTRSDAPEHAHLQAFVHPMMKLSSDADAASYPLPDVEADYRYADLPGRIASIQGEGHAAMASSECSIFEIAWYMRSMELLLLDFVENPGFAETLLDRITAKREIQAARYSALGVDVIRLGDDVASQHGMMMSVPMWRRWLKPRLARIIAAAKAARPDVLVFYHTDGNATAIVPDLIEIGLDILNPIQSECMDPACLKREFGRDLAFWGTIGTQSTLPFGTPEDVRAEVKLRMETVGVGGGLLLAPTHMIEPEVPWENIVAAVDAVNEFGWYR